MSKKVILVLALLGLGFSANAGLHKREKRQEKRIEHAAQAGQLTDAEKANLDRGQKRIDMRQEHLKATKAEAMKDGQLDQGEKAQIVKERKGIRRAENRQNRQIRRKANNNRVK